ncbi:calpain-2 catalytic subunit-like [Eleginops maclovinus]|uniref:calpain-2 catalytic subunit-like n=1 Tax=Eleginops maclovinus TaxID=56733 RepID=UPI0030810B20
MASTAADLARLKTREEEGSLKAVRFQQQDFHQLRAESLKSGELFCDPFFPADCETLGFNTLGRYFSRTRGIEWKRPTELSSDPQFIVDGAKRTDICQGTLGDCWLLAALASLTLDPQILDRVVPLGQSFSSQYAGIFHFQLWRFGEWVDVVIDDRLPVREGKLLFVHSAEGREFWSALLEKAYAKVSGSYEALTGGSSIEGFEDFTGGISESYDLKKAPPTLFHIMRRGLKLGSLMGCSIDISSSPETEAVTGQKLVKGHAYSITAVRQRAPPLNRMCYADFLRQFSRLDICNLSPDTLSGEGRGLWSYMQFEGVWGVGSTAGGCRNYPATFCSNPQFLVRLLEEDEDLQEGEEGCTLILGLMQRDARRERRYGGELNTIGFSLYRVPDEYKGSGPVHLGPEVLLREAPVTRSRSFINLREVCELFVLPPGEYAVIPSTFEPHRKGSFVLRVFTEKHAHSGPLEEELKADIQEIDEEERDVDPHFRRLFLQISGNDSEDSAFELQHILDRVVSQRSDVKTDGFSLQTCRDIISLLDTDGSNKLGLKEFHGLWTRIQKYLEVFQMFDSDASGTMSSHEMRAAVTAAEMFKTLDVKKEGKIHLDLQQWLCLTIS